MTKNIFKGEYAAPEISVIVACSEGVLCASPDVIIPGGSGYDYEPW